MNKLLLVLALFSITIVHQTVAENGVSSLADPTAAVDPASIQDDDDDDQDPAGVDENGIWIGGVTPTQVDIASGTDDLVDDDEVDNAVPDSDDEDNALADSDNGQYDSVILSDANSDDLTSSSSSIPNIAAGANLSPSKTSYTDATWISVCLQYHNVERAKVGVPSLKWSSTLAKQSYAWSKNMASTRSFRHSRTAHTGENIAETTSSTDTLFRLFRVWIQEKLTFRVGCTFPNCAKTSAEVGHYTAMVWRTTTQVGCAWAQGPSFKYLTCQYLPSGNVLGSKVY